MEKAVWTGECRNCKWGYEYKARSETEQRNPYPSGLICKFCGKDIVFLERQQPILNEQKTP